MATENGEESTIPLRGANYLTRKGADMRNSGINGVTPLPTPSFLTYSSSRDCWWTTKLEGDKRKGSGGVGKRIFFVGLSTTTIRLDW